MISWPPVGRPRPRGANSGRNDGIGSRATERVEKDGGESERRSIAEAGELSQGAPWREGDGMS